MARDRPGPVHLSSFRGRYRRCFPARAHAAQMCRAPRTRPPMGASSRTPGTMRDSAGNSQNRSQWIVPSRAPTPFLHSLSPPVLTGIPRLQPPGIEGTAQMIAVSCAQHSRSRLLDGRRRTRPTPLAPSRGALDSMLPSVSELACWRGCCCQGLIAGSIAQLLSLRSRRRFRSRGMRGVMGSQRLDS